MTMERARDGLNALGHPDLAARMDGIRADFMARNPGISDIPLSGKLPQLTESRTEILPAGLSAETQRLVEQMQSNGYAVYETTGKTPADARSEGMKFWFLNPKLEKVSAAPALLAFKPNPSEFFLPGSQGILHDDQLKLIPQEQARVDEKYPEEDLIVREGALPEWTEVALRHFKATGVRIFGRDYGYKFTWTSTCENEEPSARRASFGYWSGASGAAALLWRPDIVAPDLRLASLVEIPRK